VHEVRFARGFFIGKYAVSTARYEACQAQNAGACTPPSVADWDGGGWGLNRSPARATHPQNGLTWEQAGAHCAWIGARLPSEAEWEYAAKGPAHRVYPWGAGPAPSCANGTAVYDEAAAGYGCGQGGTWPVGSKAAGAAWSGALDMAGNVWEWNEDWYHDTYADAPADGTAWVLPVGSLRLLRGGCFNGTATDLRSAERNFTAPASHGAAIGARCSRSLP
jgi:formylglycine-generating enzyme required for sulfatase activity